MDPLPQARQARRDRHARVSMPDDRARRPDVLVDALGAWRAELAPVPRDRLVVARQDVVRVDVDRVPEQVHVVEDRRGLDGSAPVAYDVRHTNGAVSDDDFAPELEGRAGHLGLHDAAAGDLAVAVELEVSRGQRAIPAVLWLPLRGEADVAQPTGDDEPAAERAREVALPRQVSERRLPREALAAKARGRNVQSPLRHQVDRKVAGAQL